MQILMDLPVSKYLLVKTNNYKYTTRQPSCARSFQRLLLYNQIRFPSFNILDILFFI
jgi:hypothetical protein